MELVIIWVGIDFPDIWRTARIGRFEEVDVDVDVDVSMNVVDRIGVPVVVVNTFDEVVNVLSLAVITELIAGAFNFDVASVVTVLLSVLLYFHKFQ